MRWQLLPYNYEFTCTGEESVQGYRPEEYNSMRKAALILILILMHCVWANAQRDRRPNVRSAQKARKLPSIDVHLHALSADDQGPPPYKMGIPFDDFGYWDPKDDYASTFWKAMK